MRGLWAPEGVSHFCYDGITHTHYEIQWDHSRKLAKITPNGVFGCAKVIRRSCEGDFAEGDVFHAHICAHHPCQAKPLGSEAIAAHGPVRHIRESLWRPPELAPAPLPPPPSPPAAPPTPALSVPATPVAAPPLEPASPASSCGSPSRWGSEAPELELAASPQPLEHEGAPEVEAAPLPQPPEPAAFPLGVPPEPPVRSILQIPNVAAPLSLEMPVTAVAEEPRGSARLVQTAEATILQRVMSLSAEIRSPRGWVGYSGFACFAMRFKCRPIIWEGPVKIDVVSDFSIPLDALCECDCAVEAVRCCLISSNDGHIDIKPVSEHHSLDECRHYMAACETPNACAGIADAQANVHEYYDHFNRVLLSTTCDGDSALDVMARMIGRESTYLSRCVLRDEIADWILQVGSKEWFWDVLMATHEILEGDLKLLRDSREIFEAPAEAPQMIGANGSAAEALALDPTHMATSSAVTEAHLAALSWATGLPMAASLMDLARSLPVVVLDQQLALHQAEQVAIPVPPAVPGKILVHAHLLKSRMQVAEAFNGFLTGFGWTPGTRIPRNACATFCARHLTGRLPTRRAIIKWHKQWCSTFSQLPIKKSGRPLKIDNPHCKVGWNRRRRALGTKGVGAPHKCPWLRNALFEWFASIRYSIDWQKVRASLHTPGLSTRGMGKSLARFTRQLVWQKAQQLLNDYCASCLINAIRPSVPKLRSDWFRSWEAEYGLSMRSPNRKYKVPKWVMGERLEIAWMNIARVRALCVACHGYDPHMENWDQSPFHNNETGSANQKTLAVSGVTVPLVEGHADTRKRWTANLVTYSDKERITRERQPYCEFVFKGGEKLQSRLRQHIRDQGYGPWLSVATTDSASYKTPDVIEFLKTHLPKDFTPQLREWRIIIADAFSAHLAPQVFNLCWSRGYVLITLGGGITPVVQTCDTDLNQHVKRKYMELETLNLLQQMRDGVCVPHNSPECCIDLMAEVLMNTSLHLDAADGYVKTGLTVPLDGSGDQFIVREAGNFWRERGMRHKINDAVKQVQYDFSKGRLAWSYNCVKQIIIECPTHKQYDDILRRIEADDMDIPACELPYLKDDDDHETDADSDGIWDDDEAATAVAGQIEQGLAGDEEAEAREDNNATDMADASLPDEHEAQCCDLAGLMMGEDIANHVAHCTNKINVYENAMDSFQEAGAIKLAAQCKNALDAERRRLRHLTKEDPAVARHLLRMQDAEDARQRKRRRELAEENDRANTLKRLKADIKAESAKLKAEQAKLRNLEDCAAVKTAMATYTPAALGHDVVNWRQAKYRDKRYQVLDKLSKLGQGLSPAQRVDFGWFKEAWDAWGLAQYETEWGVMFASMVQNILTKITAGVTNAFSEHVYNETRRVLDTPAIRV